MPFMDNKIQSSVDMSGYENVQNMIANLENRKSDIESKRDVVVAKITQVDDQLNVVNDEIKDKQDTINDPSANPAIKAIRKLQLKPLLLKNKAYTAQKEKLLEPQKRFWDKCIARTQALIDDLERNSVKSQLKKIENKKVKGSDGKVLAKAKDGKVDFAKGKAKKLAGSQLFDGSGNPTPNFDKLKQIIAEYPQSITTLPDSVINALHRQTIMVPRKLGGVTTNVSVSGFEYMEGVAAAGFKLAEKQGRTSQSSPSAIATFSTWRTDKANMLGTGKAIILAKADASTKNGEFTIL